MFQRTIMRMIYTVLLSLTTFLVVGSNVVSAKRRVSPPKCALVAPIERLKTSKAVFSGRVLEVKESEGIQVVKFTVSKSWKYVRADEIVVTNFVHHEGPYFHQGKSYLVYAYEREGKLSTGGCSGTVEIEHARDDIRQLDKWKARNKAKGRAKA
jgi:hypothetical protein